MNNLIYMTSRDFKLEQGQDNIMMTTQVGGLSLLFYYSQECKKCPGFLEEFRTVARRIPSCVFIVVNIDQDPNIINMTKKTNTPLDYVPYIIMYVDGKPFMEYKGPKISSEL